MYAYLVYKNYASGYFNVVPRCIGFLYPWMVDAFKKKTMVNFENQAIKGNVPGIFEQIEHVLN